jgi:hypothetical protein
MFGRRRNGGWAVRRVNFRLLCNGLVAVPLTLLAGSGCGTVLDAPRFVVDVVPTGMQVDITSRDAAVPVGETVLVVHNQSDRPVRVLLLKDAPALEKLPRGVLDAVSSRDSAYVVAASATVNKRKNLLSSGGLGYQVFSTSFHVHLSSGHRYTVVAVGSQQIDDLQVRSGEPAR